STLLILALVVGFAGAIGAGFWIRRKRRDARLREQHMPYVVMPILATLDVARPVRRVALHAQTPPSQQALSLDASPAPIPHAPALSAFAGERSLAPPPPPPPVRRLPRLSPGAGRGVRRVAGAAPNEISIVDPAAEYATLVDGHSLRFYRPAEGTLQFLPGRLEVIEGRDAGHEIRFVRTSSADDVITFGRLEGPPYRHIQLREPTVSRQHARMQLREGKWHLENLSGTNPVVVNGAPLSGQGATIALRDGDRVEMGEVTFRFIA
ncbi:MAG TPA: FHA domain-containing protein, partial [Gemmatimonadaceae bacterium]|nr:FHA domain-containing protein [Gemmatimonadaceae bacterium]